MICMVAFGHIFELASTFKYFGKRIVNIKKMAVLITAMIMKWVDAFLSLRIQFF